MSYLKSKLPEADAPIIEPMERWRVTLLKAAQYIREHGHCKGSFVTKSGEVCAMGAIQAVGPLFPALIVLEKVICGGSMSIALWNDAPERTASEVIAALEKAARS